MKAYGDMEQFRVLGVNDTLLDSLKAMNFEKPTPIQEQTIPHALKGNDVLGSAQTGTGKTAAFGIPLVSHLINNTTESALVLAPTRELALQVHTALKQILGTESRIKSALLIGGDSLPKQIKELKQRPRLLVGTPGRVNDHLERGTLMLAKASFLVLDEMDRMLDMGFSVQIDSIIKYLPQKRQTLMFSATLPDAIERLAGSYLKEAVRISVGSTAAPADKVKQEIVRLSPGEKYTALKEQLDNHEQTVIVFVKTKLGADKMAKLLAEDGYEAHALHGDLRQARRERLVRAFRQQRFRVMVATDVAARGLDISHIGYVINYDLPQCPEDYIHRIGRTGRAGAEGVAVSFLTKYDGEKWRAIVRLMAPDRAAEVDIFEQEGSSEKYGRGERRARRPARRNDRGSSRPFRRTKESQKTEKQTYFREDRREERFDERGGYARRDRDGSRGRFERRRFERPYQEQENSFSFGKKAPFKKEKRERFEKEQARPRYFSDRPKARPFSGERMDRPRFQDRETFREKSDRPRESFDKKRQFSPVKKRGPHIDVLFDTVPYEQKKRKPRHPSFGRDDAPSFRRPEGSSFRRPEGSSFRRSKDGNRSFAPYKKNKKRKNRDVEVAPNFS
jgi:ATP-dependent RNA helicase DeaD